MYSVGVLPALFVVLVERCVNRYVERYVKNLWKKMLKNKLNFINF